MSGLRSIIFFLVVLSLIALPNIVNAETSPVEMAKTPAPHSILNQPGRDLRVAWPGNKFQGSFERLAADTLWLRSAEAGSVPIAADSIRSVWMRGNAAGKGALIGGLVGAGLCLGFVALVSHGLEDDETKGKAMVAGTLVGFAGGALLGVLIGSGTSRWNQHWPRPR